MIAFRKGQVIWRHDVEWEVVRSEELVADAGDTQETNVLIENRASGMREKKDVLDLLGEYVAGSLKVAQDKFMDLRRDPPKVSEGPLPPTASDPARLETIRRVDYITRLEREGAFGANRRNLAQKIKEISIERGELRPPHISTVYRWYRKFRDSLRQVRAVTCAFDNRGGKGRGRLQGEVEAIILEQIDEVFLAKKRSSAEEVLDAVILQIDRYNLSQVASKRLTKPSLRTIQRRLRELCAFELAVARYGLREAERRFAMNLGARRVSRILEIVEIDHSPIDCLVVDEKGRVRGRPWVTVVLDRYSRVVLGYHLSLAGHGTEAVFEAIRHALMPKTYLNGKYNDLELNWFAFGWPERVVMDNGREFHGKAVVSALIEIAVLAEFASSNEPNDKPHVERFIKTLNYCFIHRLPGTTLASVDERVGFKAEEEAILTLEKLDRLIHNWICNKYHLRPNGGLHGRSPASVWRESAAANPPQLKMNAGDLEIVFSRTTQSSIQNDGIDLNTFKFVNEELLMLRRLLPSKERVDVRWPAHDAGHIWVWDSLNNRYLKVPNKDESLAGLTVDQAKAAMKALADDGSEYRAVAATAAETHQAILNEAMNAKKLSARRKAAKHGNVTSKQPREQDSTPEPQDASTTAAQSFLDQYTEEKPDEPGFAFELPQEEVQQ
jgi:putative transposase